MRIDWFFLSWENQFLIIARNQPQYDRLICDPFVNNYVSYIVSMWKHSLEKRLECNSLQLRRNFYRSSASRNLRTALFSRTSVRWKLSNKSASYQRTRLWRFISTSFWAMIGFNNCRDTFNETAVSIYLYIEQWSQQSNNRRKRWRNSLSTFRLGWTGSCCVCRGSWLVVGATRVTSLVAFRDGHFSGCARGGSCCSLNRPIMRLISCCDAIRLGTPLSLSLAPNWADRSCRISDITCHRKSLISVLTSSLTVPSVQSFNLAAK